MRTNPFIFALLVISIPILADTTLIRNINGYTLTSKGDLMSFKGLKFTNDRIDAVYLAEPEALSDADNIIDGLGKTLIPGLIDAHGHVGSYGLSLLRVDLVGTMSEEEAAVRVREFADSNPDLDWILGRGWNQVLWGKTDFPAASSLDELISDRPVWLTRVDGHAGWANSAALQLAEIDRSTTDPVGGQIIRDEDGAPTGVLVDTAMNFVSSKVPRPTLEDEKIALTAAMQALAEYGLTSVHDAGISSQTVRAYRELVAESPLKIRINAMLSASDPLYQDRLAEGIYSSLDETLVINSVKIVSDGALGSRGAALIEDYTDESGNRGLLRYNDERLEFLMRVAMNSNFQVNTHAIGDNANLKVLDNYERLINETGSRFRRHRIEHAQILRYEDIRRFNELGVLPSMQAIHATSDKNMAQNRLGEVRIQGAYAWRKLIDAGARIANGSDFPVESPNPFWGLHAAVTRQDRDGQPSGGWFPEERMTLTEAFASFTIDAAYAGHQETIIGSLETGKKADFIFLDRDIFTIPESEIWKTRATETWVNGIKVTE
ncbi:MAG: amidohydrolase [Gammaproteobacteria bacterium]|nr:amidohydrolase [Gammaproteobacteria bacterium]